MWHLEDLYLFDMTQTGGTNQDGIPMVAFHQAVVGDPTKSNFSHGESMFFRDSFDSVNGIEIRLLPVPEDEMLAARMCKGLTYRLEPCPVILPNIKFGHRTDSLVEGRVVDIPCLASCLGQTESQPQVYRQQRCIYR